MHVLAPLLSFLHMTYGQTAVKLAVSLADQHGQEDTTQEAGSDKCCNALLLQLLREQLLAVTAVCGSHT
jgi:hypothetical protein